MSQGRVGAAVAEKSDKPEIAVAEQRLRASRDWLSKVIPSHEDADRFVALALLQLRKDPKMMQAASADPVSFMGAVNECASLGLVPGETYHFAPFWNNKDKRYEIVGMVDYKGEVEMIYRAGGVASVHFEVVRDHDPFLWRPGMELPMHEIADNGLADDEARGMLRGVYAYARMAAGGFSQVIVMNKDTVFKHKAVAKTTQFWGESPDKYNGIDCGPWEPQMWIKTALHALYNVVPHSAEYRAEYMRTQALIADAPSAAVAAPALRSPSSVPGVPDAPDMQAINGPPPAAAEREQQPATRAGSRRQPKRPQSDDASQIGPGQVTRLTRLLRECQVADDQMAGALTRLLGHDIGQPEDVTRDEFSEVVDELKEVAATHGDEKAVAEAFVALLRRRAQTISGSVEQ